MTDKERKEKMTGIIVCGGRDFNDWQLLEASLDNTAWN